MPNRGDDHTLEGMSGEVQRQRAGLDLESARRLAACILDIGGAKVKRIVLFGSRARGQARADSDMDLLVLVDERDPVLERDILDGVYVELLTHEPFRPVDVIVYPEHRWQERLELGDPFQVGVEEDGLELWTMPRAA